MMPVFLSPQNLRVAPTAESAPAAPAAATAAKAGDVDFSDVLQRLMEGAAEKLKAGEVTAKAGIAGKASVQDVAEAVMAAEQALQTSIAIRDKAVAAYLEISRMQI